MISSLQLVKQIQKIEYENEDLRKRVLNLQNSEPNPESLTFKKAKRKRRIKTEVVRKYKCQVPVCDKSYGFV